MHNPNFQVDEQYIKPLYQGYGLDGRRISVFCPVK